MPRVTTSFAQPLPAGPFLRLGAGRPLLGNFQHPATVLAWLALIGFGFVGQFAWGQTGQRPPASESPTLSSRNDASAWRKLQGDLGCMGTRFRLVLFAKPDQVEAGEAAIDAAMDRIEQLDTSLSDYRETSELSQLCRRAPVKNAEVSQDLWRVLLEAKRVWAASGGKFDPTIGPYSRLWRAARRSKQAPSPSDLQAASMSVGGQWLEVSPEAPRVSLLRPGMQLDLGGIAKGFAADEALAVLKARGFPSALVEGGGDMALGDPPPGKPGWRIAVAALEKDQPPTRILELANAGLATSGDLWQFVEFEGKRYSHLIDPQTGMGVTRRSSVTTVAGNATLADAWASAGSVMAPADALSVWRRHQVEGLVLWMPDGAQKGAPVEAAGDGADSGGAGQAPATTPQQSETEGLRQFSPRQHTAKDGL